MSRSMVFTALAASVCFAAATFAQAPAGAPTGSTGMCKDGTYYSGATKKGACRGHKGVQDWYAAAESASGATPTATVDKKMHGTAKPAEAAATESASAGPAPAGATGVCKDGTYYSGATKKGACRGHKGVKDWYAAAQAQSAAPPPTAAMTKTAPAAAPAPIVPAAAPMAAAPPKSTYAPPAMAAPGGGSGQVWANKKTKVYHCSTDRWYGKTKEGVYMSEADAKAQGFHADHGKACQ